MNSSDLLSTNQAGAFISNKGIYNKLACLRMSRNGYKIYICTHFYAPLKPATAHRSTRKRLRRRTKKRLRKRCAENARAGLLFFAPVILVTLASISPALRYWPENMSKWLLNCAVLETTDLAEKLSNNVPSMKICL